MNTIIVSPPYEMAMPTEHVVTTAELEAPTRHQYIHLEYEGKIANIAYSEGNHIKYFTSTLCKQGLRQCHVAESGGKILDDVHITRIKR